MKKLSLTEDQAVHVYEWLRMYWLGEEGNRFGDCPRCEQIGLRLERMIGPKMVRRVARAVLKYPTHEAAVRYVEKRLPKA